MPLTALETYNKYRGYILWKQRQAPVDPELSAINFPSPEASVEQRSQFYRENEPAANALLTWINDKQQEADAYIAATSLFKQYQQYSAYLYTQTPPNELRISLPERGCLEENFIQFYVAPGNRQSLKNLEEWIKQGITQYALVVGKKIYVYIDKTTETLCYQTYDGKIVHLNDPKYGEITRKIQSGKSLTYDENETILTVLKNNVDIPASSTAAQRPVYFAEPPANRLYTYINHDGQLVYRPSGPGHNEELLEDSKYASIKEKITKDGVLTDTTDQNIILKAATANGDIKHRIINQYLQQIDKSYASADIAYIFNEYIQKNPPQGVKLPPSSASYNECKAFFNNPENFDSANNLSDWFQKNLSTIHQYYQDSKDLLEAQEKRWVEVSTAEIQTRLTPEYLKENYIVDITRLLNGLDSLQEPLFPYEAVQILDEFMPVLNETGNMKEAEAHIAKRMTAFLAKKFANVLTFVDTCDKEVLARLFPEFSENTAREMLKKQLCFVIFLQPLFNYQFAPGIDEETKLGRIAAYRVMSEIINRSLDAQIEGATATLARAETFIDRASEKQKLIETTNKSLEEETILQEPRPFKKSLHEIYKDSKKFKATEGGDPETLFLDRGLKYKDYVMPSKAGCIAYIQLRNPQTRQIFQDNGIAVPNNVVPSSQKYSLELTSNPHGIEDSEIKDNVIYVSTNGDYIVRALDGQVKRAGFEIKHMPTVDALKSPEFLQYMLTVTSAAGYTTKGEEQQFIEFYAEPKHEESAQKIFQWNQDRARYCASIAYIYKDYVNNPSNKRHWFWNRGGLPDSIELPKANASYQDCINFYSHPARSASADALSTWFNANRKKVEKWYEPGWMRSLASVFGMSNKLEYKSKLSEAKSFLPLVTSADKLPSINDARYDSSSILNPKPPVSMWSYLYNRFIASSPSEEPASSDERERLISTEEPTISPGRSDSVIFHDSTTVADDKFIISPFHAEEDDDEVIDESTDLFNKGAAGAGFTSTATIIKSTPGSPNPLIQKLQQENARRESPTAVATPLSSNHSSSENLLRSRSNSNVAAAGCFKPAAVPPTPPANDSRPLDESHFKLE